MKTITFYSYKGGVGRSLTLSNIAMRLADLGKKVCIIDFDLEAPGLHLKFNKHINRSEINKGIVEYISDFQNKDYVPKSINEYVTDVNYLGTLNGSIKLIPAGDIYSNEYWKNLSSINWKDLFYSEENNGVNLLLHLKELIKIDLNPDFILIDSRTGITDISGIAMTLLADSVVTLAANNDENISGTARIIKSLMNNENNLLGRLPKIYFVLTRIPYYPNPDEKHKEIRISRKALLQINKGEKLIDKVFVIHSDRDLEEEERFKINNISEKTTSNQVVPIEEDYLTLFEELTKDDLTDEELCRFNDLRESELLIEEARNIVDNAVKINKLKKAIELNSNSHEAIDLLGLAFIDLKNYEEALFYARKASEIDDKDWGYKYHIAYCLDELNQTDEAKIILENILKGDERNSETLSFLGNIHCNKLEYGIALNYQLKVVEYFPDYDNGYNSVGNTYRLLKNYEKAFEYVYKCLELSPKNFYASCTLAEIYAELGNENEFYKNLQLSFIFGMNSETFDRIVNEDELYKKYFKEERFLNLLKTYRIKVNLQE
ncbi:KGGVGR-motif variant AAA ATPase [Flavobacterium marginilacus]|uniref:KGGVGR-motif variant AAA ATPase n=1 Tax=Flavobacterium marginilacus TaxID=3003256 RepID=UPI00248D9C10|nr:AAA family ATPase [Flavobacterium marginilacus]